MTRDPSTRRRASQYPLDGDALALGTARRVSEGDPPETGVASLRALQRSRIAGLGFQPRRRPVADVVEKLLIDDALSRSRNGNFSKLRTAFVARIPRPAMPNLESVHLAVARRPDHRGMDTETDLRASETTGPSNHPRNGCAQARGRVQTRLDPSQRPAPIGTREAVCASCWAIFMGIVAFDRHQRLSGNGVACRDPESVGLFSRIKHGRVVWGQGGTKPPVAYGGGDR